jgi:hypothetical protein
LVVPGRHGSEYVLHLDTGGLRPEASVRAPAGPGATRPAAHVTPRERQLLAALCEPLLIFAGDDAVPATYREIAARVHRSSAGVRTCLDGLRRKLTERDGIPGLRGAEGEHDAADFRGALARWALNSGTIRRADLALLVTSP